MGSAPSRTLQRTPTDASFAHSNVDGDYGHQYQVQQKRMSKRVITLPSVRMGRAATPVFSRASTIGGDQASRVSESRLLSHTQRSMIADSSMITTQEADVEEGFKFISVLHAGQELGVQWHNETTTEELKEMVRLIFKLGEGARIGLVDERNVHTAFSPALPSGGRYRLVVRPGVIPEKRVSQELKPNVGMYVA